MISITYLAMQYGQKTLFENASLNFDPGKRYGLVGANGSGKSTLLRIISGEELPSKGLVSIPKNLSPGLLKQDHFRYENVKVSDVVLQGNPRLWNAFSEKEQLLAENSDDEESGNRLAHLEVIIAEEELLDYLDLPCDRNIVRQAEHEVHGREHNVDELSD